GIRDFHVTGVQTCALPISWVVLKLDSSSTTHASSGMDSAASKSGLPMFPPTYTGLGPRRSISPTRLVVVVLPLLPVMPMTGARRSEERRVGKEGRSGGWG